MNDIIRTPEHGERLPEVEARASEVLQAAYDVARIPEVGQLRAYIAPAPKEETVVPNAEKLHFADYVPEPPHNDAVRPEQMTVKAVDPVEEPVHTVEDPERLKAARALLEDLQG